MKVLTGDGYAIESLDSGLNVTMSETSSLLTAAIVPDSLINSAINTYTFTFIPSSPIQTLDILRLEFPAEIKLSSSP